MIGLIGADSCVAVRATPNARADEIRVDPDTKRLLIATTATPENGKANEAVLTLLAAALGMPKSRLTLVAGAGSRDKRVRID